MTIVDLLKRIEAIIEEPLQARGYGVVRVQLSGGTRKVLQIMIERIDDVSITVEDCTTVSRLVSVLLDVEDPIKDPFILEVSSPGLERPLVKVKDFERFCGEMVLVTTHQPVNGRKRFQGLLTAVDEGGIRLNMVGAKGEDEVIVIDFENTRAARLVIDFDKVPTK